MSHISYECSLSLHCNRHSLETFQVGWDKRLNQLNTILTKDFSCHKQWSVALNVSLLFLPWQRRVVAPLDYWLLLRRAPSGHQLAYLQTETKHSLQIAQKLSLQQDKAAEQTATWRVWNCTALGWEAWDFRVILRQESHFGFDVLRHARIVLLFLHIYGTQQSLFRFCDRQYFNILLRLERFQPIPKSNILTFPPARHPLHSKSGRTPSVPTHRPGRETWRWLHHTNLEAIRFPCRALYILIT